MGGVAEIWYKEIGDGLYMETVYKYSVCSWCQFIIWKYEASHAGAAKRNETNRDPCFVTEWMIENFLKMNREKVVEENMFTKLYLTEAEDSTEVNGTREEGMGRRSYCVPTGIEHRCTPGV